MIRLFVIDDHPVVIDGIRGYEDDHFRVTGSSCSIPEAIMSIVPEQTDIILLDLFLRDEFPPDNINLLLLHFPEIPVVMISQDTSMYWQSIMFARGARAYVSKSESEENLKRILERVKAGETIIPSEIADLITYKGKFTKLERVTRTNEILHMMVQGKDIKEIARDMKQSKSSIEKKLRRLRYLLNVNNNYELIYKYFVKKIGKNDM